jgi:pyruvate,water dikinase
MAQLVVGLDRRQACREGIAGGKGASLARLRRNGFPVPDGFVVSANAFDSVVGRAGYCDLTRLVECSAQELAALRQKIAQIDLPSRLADRLAAGYLELSSPVAVRSSMVGEDGQDSSFAGQLDTHLNVSGPDQLMLAVKECWASILNERLISYMRERGEVAARPVTGFRMAVVAQRMVNAVAAGVAFSADPVSGLRCVIVEAIPGLGDALVAGMVTPDRYVVDGRGHLAEVSCAGSSGPVLDEAQTLELAELVGNVARHAGQPQDVEWAWDGERFWLLQARPITSLAGKHVYSNRVSSEMAPGLIKPLLYTTNTSSMTENVFGRVFTNLIGPNDIDFTRLGKRVHSRQYTNLTVLGELFERVGLPANFNEWMSRDERGERRRPTMGPRMLIAAFRLLRFAIRHGWIADEIAAFNLRHSRELECFRRADYAGQDPPRLIAAFDELRRMHGETQWYVFLGPVNMLIRNRHMASLARKHAPDVVPGDLIKGLVGLKALEPNNRLHAMADRASAMGNDVVSLLASGDDSEVRLSLSSSEAGQALLAEFDDFQDEFGFLSTNGTDFTVAPWAETSGLLWRSISRSAMHPAPHATEAAAVIRERSRTRLRSQLNALQRIHFDRLLRTTCRYIDLRERTSMLMSEDAYQARRILLALAERLVARGDLGERDDIFYLEYGELCDVVARSLAPGQARGIVAERRAEMAADAEIELPDTFCGDRPPVTAIRADEGAEVLVGIPGSSGVATGVARIIHDPAEAPPSLSRQDILVVPFTDVGWTPLFAGIGAIVAETGGQLSHTAIVAREYGLPAVVSVKNATRLITRGQWLAVDGTTGKVRLRPDPTLT